MRIVSLFFRYSLTLAIFLLVVGVIAREVFLFWGIQQLKNALRTTEISAKLSDDYDKECRQIGGGKSGGGIDIVQLRFTDDTNYVVEVICQYFSNTPITVSSYTLPPMVKKYPGSSGYIWSTKDRGVVTLEVYSRKNSLVLNEGRISLVQGIPEDDLAVNMPPSVCSGYGFQCCSSETQVGEDGQQFGASDCPQQCFQTCTARPTVLKLTSDPLPSLDTRTVKLRRGDPITFYYVIDSGKTAASSITLGLGDGQTQTLTELEGQYSHQYNCTEAQCSYKVELTAVDQTGISSVATAISTISVVVE